MLPPPVGFLPVACLESLPRPLVHVFDELIDFRRVGYYKVRVFFFFLLFRAFAFKYNTAPPLYITR